MIVGGLRIFKQFNFIPRSISSLKSVNLLSFYSNYSTFGKSRKYKYTPPDMSHDIFYGQEVLNRVSFLREDKNFLSSAVSHSSAKFIFLQNLNPIVKVADGKVELLIASNDTFLKELMNKWAVSNHAPHVDARAHNPTVLFMGIEDESVGLDINSNDETSYLTFKKIYKGVPYFAIDISGYPDVYSHLQSKYENIKEAAGRYDTLKFSNSDASLFSYAKMFLDWLLKNQFCPGCGSKVVPINAGAKLYCTSEEKQQFTKDDGSVEFKYSCPVKVMSVNNVQFPRTDSVIITAVTNRDRTKVLLGKNTRYRTGNMYSCIAGFVEPSETVEVASKREIWEETGVNCSNILICCTQPWPFPANLMIGCIGVVEFNNSDELIDLNHDKELSDARWFDVDVVRQWLKRDYSNNPENIVLPMEQSIAHRLIDMICNDKLPRL